MNKGRAKRKAVQTERKKRKKEGTWVTVSEERLRKEAESIKRYWKRYNVNQYAGTRAALLFEFQRTIIGHVWEEKPKHVPIKVQVEVMEDNENML